MLTRWEKQRSLGLGPSKRGPCARTAIDCCKKDAGIYLIKKALALVEAGDREALFKLIDQYFGKAKQAVDVTSDGKELQQTPLIQVTCAATAAAVQKLFEDSDREVRQVPAEITEPAAQVPGTLTVPGSIISDAPAQSPAISSPKTVTGTTKQVTRYQDSPKTVTGAGKNECP